MLFRSLSPELAVTQPIDRDAIYRRRRFPREVIEGCVRWYLTYRLSYRDLVALMAEWGVHISHTTIMRWVHQYVPEYEKRWNRRAKPVGSSWRMGPGPRRVTSTALSTNREKPSRRYSTPSAESLQPWPFSARRLGPACPDGHARSRSTVINRLTGDCAGFVARTDAGCTPWCASPNT